MADPGSPTGWGTRITFSRCADMIIVYLSAVAPDYNQHIQTMGQSLGGIPAIDVALRLNKIYADARYAVNRVSFLDATGSVLGESEYRARVADFLASSVDGEQCWLDRYHSSTGGYSYLNALHVVFSHDTTVTNPHAQARNWYRASLANEYANKFNHGVVAGAYWSVAGPGKNLQLASTPDKWVYEFIWFGGVNYGYMDISNEARYPGRLPEPVTLVGPLDVGDPNGVVLTCRESENAVGYQLLFGHDPYHMVYLFSDTPSPPSEPVTAFPFEQSWWTVKAYDQYGSTIHADPVQINTESVTAQTIENARTGQTYASIQQAINDALAGDAIVLSPGVCQYLEHINTKDKSLTVRSTNPDDPATVAGTVINGGHTGTVVTLSGTEETECVLAGLTILGGTVSVSCRAGSLTIRNCTVRSTGPTAIEFLEGYEFRIIDSTVVGYVHDHRLLAHWALDETEGIVAADSAGDNDGTLYGEPVWQPTDGQVDGALELDGIDDYVATAFLLNPQFEPFSIFAWIKGGAPGQVIISEAGGADLLYADPSDGRLVTSLMAMWFGPLESESVITDGDWHHIGLVWDQDAFHRHLYVDDAEVAKDTSPVVGFNSDGGLHIGAAKDLSAGSFFSGLIDDVRIYDVALSPEEIEALAR